MQELTFEQVEEVNGGLGNFAWMIIGYGFGKVVDSYADAVKDGRAVPDVDPNFVGGPHNNDPLL